MNPEPRAKLMVGSGGSVSLSPETFENINLKLFIFAHMEGNILNEDNMHAWFKSLSNCIQSITNGL